MASEGIISYDLPILPPVDDRLIYKNGEVNLSKENIGHHKHYFADIFATLIDMKWRHLLFVFIANFLFSWIIFAVFWYLVAFFHDDIDFYEEWMKADDKEVFEGNTNHTPCVRNLYTFSSALLYSIEAQSTVGYGFRHVTIECTGAPIILIIQILVGVLIEAFTLGILIAKLAKPKKRAHNILFSKNAVICHRDGSMCLMIRIGDIQKRYIVHANVKARLIRRIYSENGELLEFHQDDLPMNVDNCDNQIMLLWPTLVYHRIDAKSPLWEMTADDLQTEQFEILVMLEGGAESTGLHAQARTSYLPCEILWGHRFQSVLMPKEKKYIEVDYNFFDKTTKADIPRCAAKDLITTICIHEHPPEECDCVGSKGDYKKLSNSNLRKVFASKY